MRHLFCAMLCSVLGFSSVVQAEDEHLRFHPNDALTTIAPAPGVTYTYDQHLNSVTTSEQLPGAHFYSAQDSFGRITSQGFLFEPYPPEQELRVPESMRVPPSRAPASRLTP